MANSVFRLHIFSILICSCLTLAACATGTAKFNGNTSTFLDSRRSYTTVLKTHGPAPQEWPDEKIPPGVTEVSYTSGNLKLKAWLAMQKNSVADRVPAVVYFHGGFAFSFSELEDCRPFLNAGLAVLMPTLRGENGNPGDFELFYGEMDDAQAAVRWLVDQPHIDASRIYTFGHSVGGGVSALLSLWDDVPVRMGGSSGGLYPQDVFSGWKRFVPFDYNNEKERNLRLLVGNMSAMKRQHIAYLGYEDSLAKVAPAAEAERVKSAAPLTIKIVKGDHFTSLEPAILAFVEAIKTDK